MLRKLTGGFLIFRCMKLYEVLAAEYEEVFPSSIEKAGFVESFLNNTQTQCLLDMGCASGELVYQLSSPDREITGIDLDPLMIQVAKDKMPADAEGFISFQQAHMLRFLRGSEPGLYDLITCLGNTVVYLNGEPELKDFLISAHKALKKHGRMIVQILNYKNPQIRPGFVFPAIETERIEFNREYVSLENSVELGFKTSIRDKNTGETDTDLHRHYPFLSSRIGELAREAGFSNAQLSGGYDGKEAEDSDFFHLVVLEKS